MACIALWAEANFHGMEMRWKNCCGRIIVGQVPAYVQPYVDVIGLDAAALLFLNFGGAPLYLAKRRDDRGMLASVMGADVAAKLEAEMGRGHIRVPIAAAFIARVMRMRGVCVNEIARKVRRTDSSVRQFLNGQAEDKEPSLGRSSVNGGPKRLDGVLALRAQLNAPCAETAASELVGAKST